MPLLKGFRYTAGTLLLSSLMILAGNAFAGNSPDPGSDGQGPHRGPPPKEAIDACAKLSDGASCSFTGRRGEALTGSCHTPPQQSSLACIPAHPPQQRAPDDDAGSSRGY